MKKRLYAGLLALVLMFSMTACGKPAENPDPEQGTQGTENVDSSEKNEKPENTDVLGGVYPGGDKLEELVMGTRINGEQVEFCKVKVPSNYWIGAGYLNEEGYDNSFEMANGDDEVGKAISDGLLEQTGKIYTFYVTNANSAGEDTQLRCKLYTADEWTYEQQKESRPEHKEIKNDKIEAIYYQSSGEGASGDMSVCCSMGDKGFLLVTFDGSVVDEFGADQIAQNICDLITVIE